MSARIPATRADGDDWRVGSFALLAPGLRVPAASECLVFCPLPAAPLVRCRYRAGGWRIDHAESGAYFTVWVTGVTEPPDERARAEQVAARLFGRAVTLERFGTYHGKAYGRDKVGSSRPEDPVALRTLRWWVEGDLVGFVHSVTEPTPNDH